MMRLDALYVGILNKKSELDTRRRYPGFFGRPANFGLSVSSSTALGTSASSALL